MRQYMRKAFLLICLILLYINGFTQVNQNVIYLKNGSTIKGTIILNEPNKDIIIRTHDYKLYSFKRIEIEQIINEYEINFADYGGSYSYGVSTGEVGMIGIPLKYYRSHKFSFELGLNYRPGLFFIDENSFIAHSWLVSLGTNYMPGEKYKENCQKIKRNGFGLKGGFGDGEFISFFAAGAWVHESFKQGNKNHSFTFELGPGINYTDISIDLYYSKKTYGSLDLLIYWKLLWNWYKY